jgi:peptidoglycan glycosyltransferase
MSAGATGRTIGGNVWRTGIALATAFAVLAVGAGWWQVVEATRLSRAPDNPAVIAVARRALRGPIVDRDGRWLARSRRDANGEAVREYRDDSISHVVGYSSRQYGTAGLERTYNAELIGLGGSDPYGGLLDKFAAGPRDPLGLRLTLDLRLQRAAVDALGSDRGAVVMLDPTTGEVLALASTPTFDASAIADPDTATRTFEQLQDDPSNPLLPRATLGRYVPGSVFKVVTAIAGLSTGAISPETTFPQQPGAEKKGLLVDGFRIRDGHHPMTGDTPLNLVSATEVSCNIWYALAGLATGGDRLVDQAGALGFGAPIPFDLPTAISRVTGGDGNAPGGFADDVELASASFGQGQTFVTPLQMALVASAVADDGVLMTPHLVSAVTGEGSGARTIEPETWRRALAAADARSIQEAMQAAVEGDLGRQFTAGAAVPGVPTAGKSGTAELGGSGEPHSWFIGFAPVEAPKVAIAVLVEKGGRGGERAAPLAGSLLRRYFDLYGTP